MDRRIGEEGRSEGASLGNPGVPKDPVEPLTPLATNEQQDVDIVSGTSEHIPMEERRDGDFKTGEVDNTTEIPNNTPTMDPNDAEEKTKEGEVGILVDEEEEKKKAEDFGDHLSDEGPPGAVRSFYAAKKTVAQGMMDIALITSNANQLRYLQEFGAPGPIYYLNLSLVSTSLALQIVVGLALVLKGRADLRAASSGSSDKDDRQASAINDYIVVGVFLITIINVFMAAFAIGGGGAGSAALRGTPPTNT